MATRSVHLEIRRNPEPGRRRRYIRRRPVQHPEPRGLVELGDLGARVLHGLRLARHMIADAKAMLDLGRFADGRDELALLAADGAVHVQQVPEV
ncbi:MAG: hypothetical protein AMXMBFR56_52160 [Polyangiaceae bacterium]